MRKALFVAAILAASTTFADARPRPAGRSLGPSFQSNKTFGLGLEFGDLFGLTGKWFFSEGGSQALQFGLGYIDAFGPHGLNIYADYLWHPFVLTEQPAFQLPFFIGVGGRFWTFDHTGNGVDAFGVRVPIGISFDFENVPIDVFIQVVPTLDFYTHYVHDVYFDVDLSVGIRFYFN